MRFHRNREEEEAPEEVKPKRTRIKDEPDFEWDKKRISLALILFAIGFIAFMEVKSRFVSPEVLGTNEINRSTQVENPQVEAPKINIESDINSKISDIKDSVGALNADEVASSSPQIQKVLNDIQGIKNLPANQAKDACMKICSGI